MDNEDEDEDDLSDTHRATSLRVASSRENFLLQQTARVNGASPTSCSMKIDRGKMLERLIVAVPSISHRIHSCAIAQNLTALVFSSKTSPQS